ncbi:MAG: long-chain fatty acid--CoA ligase [Nitriliruptoraceae bacterium]
MRAEILAEIEGRTLVDVFMSTCDANGGRDALMVRDGDGFASTTWSQYREQASAVAMALRGFGIGPGGFVALMMTNRPEHVVSDVAVMLAGATPVSVYNTLTTEQIVHIARDCGASVVIVEDAGLLDRWLEAAAEVDTIEHLVVLEPMGTEHPDPRVTTFDELLTDGREALEQTPDRLEASWRAIRPEDPATLIYTSGTTGPPKGVILTHHNVLFQLAVVQRLLDVRPGQRGISYLPLAHVAERMVTHYIGLRYGGTIWFVRDMADVAETLQAARPQMFMAVPRVWEKMHAALLARIDEDPRKAPIAHRAIAVAVASVEAERAGRSVPLHLRPQRALADRAVFRRIRDGLGLDELRYAISGAAPISAELLTFFRAIGIEILEVYGMTETTAVITANVPGDARIGTVGPVLPGVELQLADDGEILTRGPNVTPGYLGDDEATRAAIDEDGWLHTGDLGTMDDDGYVSIVGRKKELIITAGGKNVSPANIEGAVKHRSPVIGQVCAVGDGRSHIAALVVLDADLLPGWCAAHDLEFTSIAELAEHPDVVAEVQRAVDEGNERLSRVEQVRRFAILSDEWTAESEELTPSLKLRRDVIHRRHADVIDGLYR